MQSSGISNMQQATPREDLHQRITNQIVAAIEVGACDYQMPWNPKLCTGPAIGLPQ
jgi:antirestriction protein ArdC